MQQHHFLLEVHSRAIMSDRMAEAERERFAAQATSNPQSRTVGQVLEPLKQRMLSLTRRIWSTQPSTS